MVYMSISYESESSELNSSESTPSDGTYNSVQYWIPQSLLPQMAHTTVFSIELLRVYSLRWHIQQCSVLNSSESTPSDGTYNSVQYWTPQSLLPQMAHTTVFSIELLRVYSLRWHIQQCSVLNSSESTPSDGTYNIVQYWTPQSLLPQMAHTTVFSIELLRVYSLRWHIQQCSVLNSSESTPSDGTYNSEFITDVIIFTKRFGMNEELIFERESGYEVDRNAFKVLKEFLLFYKIKSSWLHSGNYIIL